MADVIEVQPTDVSLLRFDGAVLELFAGQDSSVRVHIKGLEGIEVDVKRRSAWVVIKNRFGAQHGFGCERTRLPEVQEFISRVHASAGID